MIHTGDCLDVMAAMEPESVDAIVTDPPYGLEFMGKEWDRLGDVGKTSHSGVKDRDPSTPFGRTRVSYSGSSNVKCRACGKWQWAPIKTKCNCERPDFPSVKAHQGRLMERWHGEWAEAAYRVAKPSAYLLAFGGTRTVHRMTVALEDAGWIIRDMLVWAYASGFPKSKASLKPAWKPIVMARKPGPLRELAIDACRIGVEGGHEGAGPGPSLGILGDGLNGERAQPVPGLGRWPANVILTDPIFDGGVEGVVGGGEAPSAGRYVEVDESVERGERGGDGRSQMTGREWQRSNAYANDSGTYSRFFQIPRGVSCDWCGASLADPSSSQPSPPDGSAPSPVATGASHGSAITMDSLTTSGTASGSLSDDAANTPHIQRSRRPGTSPASARQSNPARFPDAANQAIDTTTITAGLSMCATCAEAITSATTSPSPEERNYPWAFLIPKADRADREPVLGGLPTKRWTDGRKQEDKDYPSLRGATERQNSHPTVKPVDLMRHLVRLVTPPGGTVLDPFLGSGTTAIAAEMEGFPWIGIEREAEYVAIAEARLNGTQRGLGLDTPAPTPRMPNTHPDLSKHQPKVRNPSGGTTLGRFSKRWTADEETA